MQVIGERLLLRAVMREGLLGEEVDHHVVAHLGDGMADWPVKAGDKVFYQHGTKVSILGEEYVLVEADQVVAVL